MHAHTTAPVLVTWLPTALGRRALDVATLEAIGARAPLLVLGLWSFEFSRHTHLPLEELHLRHLVERDLFRRSARAAFGEVQQRHRVAGEVFVLEDGVVDVATRARLVRVRAAVLVDPAEPVNDELRSHLRAAGTPVIAVTADARETQPSSVA